MKACRELPFDRSQPTNCAASFTPDAIRCDISEVVGAPWRAAGGWVVASLIVLPPAMPLNSELGLAVFDTPKIRRLNLSNEHPSHV